MVVPLMIVKLLREVVVAVEVVVVGRRSQEAAAVVGSFQPRSEQVGWRAAAVARGSEMLRASNMIPV